MPLFKAKKTKPIVTALIMAAGSGSRMNTETNKQFIYLLDKPIITHTLLVFEATECIDNIVVVAREAELLAIKDIGYEYGVSKLSTIVTGGETRQDSVMLGLAEASGSDYVAVHDGARPCITEEQITKTVQDALKYGAAAIGYKVSDTLKRVESGMIADTVDRDGLWHIQTPQIFKTDILIKAHALAKEQGRVTTDDTELLRALGMPVHMTEGSSTNIKITTSGDLFIAEGILNEYEDRQRI